MESDRYCKPDLSFEMPPAGWKNPGERLSAWIIDLMELTVVVIPVLRRRQPPRKLPAPPSSKATTVKKAASERQRSSRG